jgi:hypothetical protein
VGIYRWYYAPRDVTFIRFTFSGQVDGVEEGRALDKEIVAAHWYSRDELVQKAAMHRTPLVMTCIDDYLAGKRFPLDVFSKEFS